MDVVYSRSTAIDLLSSGRLGDSCRQHIQHQLDSLRFYDSVPLYDGLRRFTPTTTTTSAVAPDPITGQICYASYAVYRLQEDDALWASSACLYDVT